MIHIITIFGEPEMYTTTSEEKNREVIKKNATLFRGDGRLSCPENNKKNNRPNDEGKKEEINKISKSEVRARALELIGEGLFALSNESRVNITRYIQENKESSFETIRRNFNLNNNTLTFHLQKLQSAHIISQPKERGPYQVGPLGDRMLQLLDVLEGDVYSILEKMLP